MLLTNTHTYKQTDKQTKICTENITSLAGVIMGCACKKCENLRLDQLVSCWMLAVLNTSTVMYYLIITLQNVNKWHHLKRLEVVDHVSWFVKKSHSVKYGLEMPCISESLNQGSSLHYIAMVLGALKYSSAPLRGLYTELRFSQKGFSSFSWV